MRAAISVMNAQKDPPLDGYWQVDSAVITNNVIVNCKQGIVVRRGAGDRGRVRPPINCIVADNRVFSNMRAAGNPDLSLIGVNKSATGPQ